MRFFLAILPALVIAQTPPPTKAPAAAKPPASKPPTATAPKPAAVKPAAARPASAAPAKPPAAKPVAAAKPKPAVAPKGVVPVTDDEKMIYALGLSMFRSLQQFELSPAEMELVKRALSDAAAGKPAVQLDEWGPKIQGLITSRQGKVLEREKVASKAYLDKVAAEPGNTKTETGIVYRDLTVGSGASPKSTDTVKVHYRGTLISGTEFDSSYKRNEPAQFPLTGVIPCWTQGLQKMKVGGKARLVCPSDIAYGDRGRPSIPPGAALIFEVELLDIVGGAAQN